MTLVSRALNWLASMNNSTFTLYALSNLGMVTLFDVANFVETEMYCTGSKLSRDYLRFLEYIYIIFIVLYDRYWNGGYHSYYCSYIGETNVHRNSRVVAAKQVIALNFESVARSRQKRLK